MCTGTLDQGLKYERKMNAMNDLELRELTDNSRIEELLALIRSYPHSAEEMLAIQKVLLSELSEIGDNRCVYGGFRGDEMVAFVQIILNNADNDPDYADGKQMAHVHHLRVGKDLQGLGIGRKMMQLVEQKAREMGKTVLTLGVDEVNTRAFEMYKQLGYDVFKREQGRTPDEFGYGMRKSIEGFE